MADPNLLGKALSNVIGNAVQNTEKGGRVLIFTKRAVRDAGQEKKISLHILNFGASIPKDLLPKLFEPFYHADPARTRSVSRTGLGLTIVRKSLEMMQVPHRLENTADGVLFTMELPCGK